MTLLALTSSGTARVGVLVSKSGRSSGGHGETSLGEGKATLSGCCERLPTFLGFNALRCTLRGEEKPQPGQVNISLKGPGESLVTLEPAGLRCCI